MNRSTARPEPPPSTPVAPRLFLREPGWRIAVKVGSERAFCYTMAPGQEHYHHIRDGEVYVYRGDERLCLPCADRQGLFAHEPRPLREPIVPVDLEGAAVLDVDDIPLANDQ